MSNLETMAVLTGALAGLAIAYAVVARSTERFMDRLETGELLALSLSGFASLVLGSFVLRTLPVADLQGLSVFVVDAGVFTVTSTLAYGVAMHVVGKRISARPEPEKQQDRTG